MVFNIDVQGVFSDQSLVFQAKDDSIISFSRAKQEMVSDLNDLRYVDDKSELKKFLANAICDDGNPCETIQGYEQSRVVTWRQENGLSLQLVNKNCGAFDKLSEIKDGYIDTILDQLNDYIPEIQLMDFDILDH